MKRNLVGLLAASSVTAATVGCNQSRRVLPAALQAQKSAASPVEISGSFRGVGLLSVKSVDPAQSVDRRVTKSDLASEQASRALVAPVRSNRRADGDGQQQIAFAESRFPETARVEARIGEPALICLVRSASDLAGAGLFTATKTQECSEPSPCRQSRQSRQSGQKV